ncbi:hypothetical protein [Tenggerimyces flavus]|uniref:Uncharacterized protein n=1 Tax=Tenggerimyces flavus TaxID=1708749 RepID=A0ABV7Y6S7_9ACTN|nr:hypothetical protein [Tenggerimyces flavus]MBM7791018.1 hypothetical protein [Tenggerimyces flavus]
MRRLTVLLVLTLLLAGCTAGGGEPPPAPSPPWRQFELDDLRFTAPADWHALEVGRPINTQESVIGLLGSVPAGPPRELRAPFDVGEGGVGIIVTNDGNFGLRRLPDDGEPCAELAGMRCVRRTVAQDGFRTNAERIVEWTYKPAKGDLIHVRVHVTGDRALGDLAAKVVATMTR